MFVTVKFLFQEKAFFSGDRITYVDFLIFDLLDNNREFAVYNVGQDKKSNVDVMEMFPKLNNFYRHFAGNPKLARFVVLYYHSTSAV